MFRRTARLLSLSIATMFLTLDNSSAETFKASVSHSSDSHLEVRLSTEPSSVNQLLDLHGTGSEFLFSSNQPDAVTPASPILFRCFIVPENATCRVEITSTRESQVSLSEMPVGGSAVSEAFDQPLLETGEMFELGGIHLLPVSIRPLRLDVDSGGLSFTHDMTISLECDASLPSALPRVSPGVANIVRRLALNPPERDDIDEEDYAGRYLVAIREECLPYAIPLLEWKRQAGYDVQVLPFDRNATADDIRATIAGIYRNAINEGSEPFEFILLIGDRVGNHAGEWVLPAPVGLPTMVETAAHADYVYGLLGEEADQVIDAAVGRITAGSRDRLNLAVNRQLAYERTPFMEDTSWFQSAGVFSQQWGDESVVTNPYSVRWGESLLNRMGFDPILRYENLVGDGDGSQIGPVIRDWFNRGLNVMIGRGQINFFLDGFQGVNDSEIFPYVINMCGHGEFPAEWIYGTGDSTHLKGPVVWTTGWGTPITMYSNVTWMSVVQGVFVYDLPVGWARALIGINLPTIFTLPEEESVPFNYQTDFDLYGDPGLQPWTTTPRRLRLAYAPNISAGKDFIGVRVTDPRDNSPVSDAQVTLYSPGQLPEPEDYPEFEPALQLTGRTTPDGRVGFRIPDGLPAGMLLITATGRNLLPEWDTVMVAAAGGPNLILEEVELVNGAIRAGGEATVRVRIRNIGATEAVNVTGVIASESILATVPQNALEFGNVGANGTSVSNREVTISFASFCPDQTIPPIRLSLNAGNPRWETSLPVRVDAPAFELGGIPQNHRIGQRILLDPILFNLGHANYFGGPARLVSLDWRLEVIDGSIVFDSVSMGSSNGAVLNDRFEIHSRPGAVPGSNVQLAMIVGTPAVIDTIEFAIRLTSNIGGGPEPADAYGYICLDDTDTLWPGCPEYLWREIQDGREAIDFGNRFTDTAVVVDLPFPLKFYGETFDQLTITTNGFVSPGNQIRQINFDNFPMKHAFGGAVGMIAPFWDRLTLVSNIEQTGIYTYYDDVMKEFIVEWYRVHPDGLPDISLTFQVVILDPTTHITTTGDNPILFQYQEIRHIHGGVGEVSFASAGISSPDSKTGLGVNFDSTGTANTPLARSRTAYLFTTTPKSSRYAAGGLQGRVGSLEGSPLSGQTVKIMSYGLGPVAEDQSDRNGLYNISAVIPGNYNLMLREPGFNPVSRAIRITAGESQEINLALTHPTISITERVYYDSLRAPEQRRRSIYFRNRGNGPLTFFISKSLDSTGNQASWPTVFPMEGIVEPGVQQQLTLTIRTGGRPEGDYSAYIIINDTLSQISDSIRVMLYLNDEVGVSVEPQPKRYELSGNFPNPFNSTSTIRYSLAKRSHVRLTLRDLAGRECATIVDEVEDAGERQIGFEAGKLPAGVYLLKMEAGEFQAVKKMVVVK